MTSPDDDPAAFTPTQKATWAGFLRTHATIIRALSAALEDEQRLTINEFEVLLCLSEHQGLRLSELAARVNLSTSGMSGMINRLARRGLIRRCTHPDDARVGYLELTDTGRATFLDASDRHVRRVKAWFLARFDDTEQATLRNFWRRFADGDRDDRDAQ